MASLSSTHYLTSDDLDKIFKSTRKSVDYLSEFDDSSTEASTGSSFWESSEAETDSTVTDDLSSEQSGSEPSELSGEDVPGSSDSDLVSNFTKPQPYNLRVRKRTKCSEFLPSAKRSRLDSDASTSQSKGEQRGQDNGGGRGGRGGGRRGGRRGQGPDRSQKGEAARKGCHSRGSRGRGKGSRGRRNIGKKKAAIPVLCVPIAIPDSAYNPPEEFCPLRDPGPHLPEDCELSALSLFEQFFDEQVINRLIKCTLSYAEFRKKAKPKRYTLFKKQPFSKEVLMAFLGALILLGIHSVRNHRKAWSHRKAQLLIRLHDLITCQRFELIGTFLHAVTPEEEEEMKDDRLRKLLPLIEYLRGRCLDLYQPVMQLSVDERMVKSRARCHMVQYMKNKPTKFGFKLWVVADPSGYTTDFDVYTGKSDDRGDKGLSHHVVVQLTEPFQFQGYHLFCDNFYSSPALFQDLLDRGIYATGTLRVDRKDVPKDVKELKEALGGRKVPRGTGYYLRDGDLVYVCWRDSRPVLALSVPYPGHQSDTKVTRKVGSSSVRQEIFRPLIIEKYNKFMGGVDKSDQFLAYHNVLRKTVRYWKTLFYHLVDIAIVNAFVIYNIKATEIGAKNVTENDFRDTLVLQIINKYGRNKRGESGPGRPCKSECRVKHGSKVFDLSQKARCQYCWLQGKAKWTQRKCTDCTLQPALCQTLDRDCHALWHMPNFDDEREKWIRQKLAKLPQTSVTEQMSSMQTRSHS